MPSIRNDFEYAKYVPPTLSDYRKSSNSYTTTTSSNTTPPPLLILTITFPNFSVLIIGRNDIIGSICMAINSMTSRAESPNPFRMTKHAEAPRSTTIPTIICSFTSNLKAGYCNSTALLAGVLLQWLLELLLTTRGRRSPTRRF